MKRFVSKALLAAAAAGLIFSASPSYASVCLAKNAAGLPHVAVGAVLSNVKARVLVKCKVTSANPDSCHIVDCN